MHELSLSLELVRAAQDAWRELCGADLEGEVVAVTVEVGDFAGVSAESLAFCFPLAAAGTTLAGAVLRVERVPVRIRCAECGAVEQLPDLRCFRCPLCGAPVSEVASGRELRLCALELRIPEAESQSQESKNRRVGDGRGDREGGICQPRALWNCGATS